MFDEAESSLPIDEGSSFAFVKNKDGECGEADPWSW